jgi:hypothetical protein
VEPSSWLVCSSSSSRNYGYALLDLLDRQGFSVDANTLYPLLAPTREAGALDQRLEHR